MDNKKSRSARASHATENTAQKTFYKLNKKQMLLKRCLKSFPNTFNGLIRCMTNNVC